MKKLVKIMSSTLAMILMVCSLAGCDFNKEEETAKSSEAETYVSLRINPEIELIANEDDEVVAVNAIFMICVSFIFIVWEVMALEH